MKNLTLQKYTVDDAEFIYQTKKEAYKIYVEQNWGEWNEEKQRDFFEEFIKAYAKDILLICLNNEKIGFYHGRVEKNCFELGNICIVPKHQGKGIGTKILKDIINENKNFDICLQYFKQNPVAKLYQRLGFEKTDETKFHIKMKLKKTDKGEN